MCCTQNGPNTGWPDRQRQKQTVDVIRGGLQTHKNDVVALAMFLDCPVGFEHDLAHRSAGGGGEALQIKTGADTSL